MRELLCHSSPGFPTNQSGSSIIELALVIPLVIFLLGAMIDTGFWLDLHRSLDHAAYEAARFGVNQKNLAVCTTGNCSSMTGHNEINNMLTGLLVADGISTTGLQITTRHYTTNSATKKDGYSLSVTAQLPFTSVFGSSLTLFGMSHVSVQVSLPYVEGTYAP